MTASSIGAAKGGGYARYLESKTVQPERGDYYLTPGGEPAQAPGRWLASADTLAQLGIESSVVDGPGFLALMEGRHPSDGGWLRREGTGGGRGGGIDVTFSAPKSVSVTWALGDEHERGVIEQAHQSAVEQAIGYMTETVPTVRRRYGGEVVEEPARELIAAEYLHTTARGVMDGDAPDPQLYSHVVVTSAVRDDGRIVAVASRPVFRSAREVGAFYRSALANELSGRGYAIDAGTGNDGRYFEIAGVPQGLLDAFSARSREVARAAERFRGKWGRAPERGELRRLKLENRKAKIPVTRADLQRVWDEKGAREKDPHADERARLSGELQRGERTLDALLAQRSHLARELGDVPEVRAERDGLADAIRQCLREQTAFRDELTERELRAPGTWVRDTFGERPDRVLAGEERENGVRRVGLYRAEYQITDSRDAIGPRPEQREQRRDWRQAREAIEHGERRLGRDVGVDRGADLGIGF